MKPAKTKAQIRAEIDAQINAFLAEGGNVDQCERGASGRTLNAPLPKSPHVERSQQSRTPVLSEIQAIEARRRPGKPQSANKRQTAERKVLITDDFGEPLRWISK